MDRTFVGGGGWRHLPREEPAHLQKRQRLERVRHLREAPVPRLPLRQQRVLVPATRASLQKRWGRPTLSIELQALEMKSLPDPRVRVPTCRVF